jgi:hypothetical protein
MKLKERVIYYAFIIICLSISFGLCYQIAEARVIDWLLGGTRTVTVVLEEKTLDSEIDRLAIKYSVASSTIRAVSKCESSMYGSAINYNYRKDGTLHSIDKGYLQINNLYHEARMNQLGLNWNDEWDSLEYGFMLMAEQGLQPWSASKSCWTKLI